MLEEIKHIIDSAQSLSFHAINKFYMELGIDPNKIREIHRPVEFGKIDENEIAHYESDIDTMILKDETIEFIKESLLSAKDREKTKKALIKNIAITITHETIHSSRTIIKDENTIDNILLSQIQISNIMEEEYVLDKNPRRIVACYAIHDDNVNKLEKLIENQEENELINQIDKYNKQIDGQEALEEILTEALAEIIINNYFYDKLSLETLTNTIAKAPNIRTDALIDAKIISLLDTETIKWFLTTRFNDNYQDMFKEEFKEDYEELLHLLDVTYKKVASQSYTRKEEQTLMPKIDTILKRKQNTKEENNSKAK